MYVDYPIICGFETRVPVRGLSFDLELQTSAVVWAVLAVWYRQGSAGDWKFVTQWDVGTSEGKYYDPVTRSYQPLLNVDPIWFAVRRISICDLSSDHYTVAIQLANSSGGPMSAGILYPEDVYVRNLKLDSTSLAGAFSISADPKNPRQQAVKDIEVHGLPEDRYDFRLWRTTEDQTGVTWQDDVYLRGYAEIINRTLAYPNHALMGVRAMATDRLYGGRPRITSVALGAPLTVPVADLRFDTCIATDEGIVDVASTVSGTVITGMRHVTVSVSLPDPAGKYFWLVRMDSAGFAQPDRLLTKFYSRVHTWQTIGGTTHLYLQDTEAIPPGTSVMLFAEDADPYLCRHTAWAVTKMLLEGSRGRITEDKIDWPSFAAWDQWNMQLKDGEPRHLFDALIDFSGDLWGIAFRAAMTARGMLVAGGGKYRVIVDRAATPVQLFSDGNGASFSIDPIPRSDRANILTTSFLDETAGYDQKDIARDDVQEGEFPNVKALPVQVGVVRESQVSAILDFMLLQNRYIGHGISLDAGIDSIECQLGDVFWAQSQAKDLAIGGRVVSIAGGICTIDQPFTPDPEVNYSLTVWGKDGELRNWTGTLEGAEITSLPAPEGLEQDDYFECPYMLCKVTEERMKFRCLGIRRNGDTLQATITGIEYRDECYLND